MNAVAPSSPVPPRRRWLRRLLVALLILVGLPTGYYFYANWSLQSDIAQAIAETDALDPRWRYEDMEADSKTYPDAENSALHILKVKRLIGRGAWPSSQKDYGPIFDQLPATARLNSQQIELLRECFDKIPEGLIEARKLKDMPHGRIPVAWDPSGIWVMLPDHQDVRIIADLLQHDAMWQAEFGDPDAALEICHALANASRAVADDTFIISVVIRQSCDWLLVQTVERILAQGQARDARLKQMQALVRAEYDDLHRQWITAVRGERAEFHRFYEPMILGKMRWLQMAESLRMRVGWEDQLNHYLPIRLIKDYPQHLRRRNELVAAARLPMPEQLEQFAILDQKVDRSDERKAMLASVLPLLPPEMTEFCSAHFRCHAILRAAAAALACERYRLKHDCWPDSLVELVKAGLLDAVPVDPFDGQPLRLARRKDGITIYSIGQDKQDNAGNIDRNHPTPSGVDVGLQLWDPLYRRQPPRPPVTLP